jgi:hypothetical protein
VYLVPTNQLQRQPAILQSINTLVQSGMTAPRVVDVDGNEEADLLFVIEISHCPDVNQRMSAMSFCDDKIIEALLARSKMPSTTFWTGKASATVFNQCVPSLSANYYYYFTTSDAQKNALRLLLMREDSPDVNGVQEFMLKTFGEENDDVEFNLGTRTVLTYNIQATYENIARFPRREFAIGAQGKAKAWSINMEYDLVLKEVQQNERSAERAPPAGKRRAASQRTVEDVVNGRGEDSDDEMEE